MTEHSKRIGLWQFLLMQWHDYERYLHGSYSVLLARLSKICPMVHSAFLYILVVFHSTFLGLISVPFLFSITLSLTQMSPTEGKKAF